MHRPLNQMTQTHGVEGSLLRRKLAKSIVCATLLSDHVSSRSHGEQKWTAAWCDRGPIDDFEEIRVACTCNGVSKGVSTAGGTLYTNLRFGLWKRV